MKTRVMKAKNEQRLKKARPLRWLKNISLGLISILAVLFIAGVIYQAVGASQDARRYPPPGQLVSVGDYQLHLYCRGEGSPTVILENLFGGISANWAWVQPEIAATTRVCVYDRAGRGWSDPGVSAQDLWGTAADLYTLLQNAEIEGPYILAGHSIGGLYVRAFTHQHPEEVAGIVLIDSSHPEQFIRHPEYLDKTYDLISRLFPAMADLGLFRFYFSTGGEFDFQELPAQQHAELVAFWSSGAYQRSVQSEGAVQALIFEQARDLPDLGDLPLGVVSAEVGQPGWDVLQSELAALSRASLHVTVPGSNHVSLAFHPDHARETSGVIIQIIEMVRDKQVKDSK